MIEFCICKQSLYRDIIVLQLFELNRADSVVRLVILTLN